MLVVSCLLPLWMLVSERRIRHSSFLLLLLLDSWRSLMQMVRKVRKKRRDIEELEYYLLCKDCE